MILGPSPYADGAMRVLQERGFLSIPDNLPTYDGTNIPSLSAVYPSAEEYETRREYSPRFGRMVTSHWHRCADSASVRRAYDFVLHNSPHLNDVVTVQGQGYVTVIVLDYLG